MRKTCILSLIAARSRSEARYIFKEITNNFEQYCQEFCKWSEGKYVHKEKIKLGWIKFKKQRLFFPHTGTFRRILLSLYKGLSVS